MATRDSDFCTQFGIMSVKALRVRDAESLQTLENFNTDAFLLDAFSKSGLGGTGEKFNWELAGSRRGNSASRFFWRAV